MSVLDQSRTAGRGVKKAAPDSEGPSDDMPIGAWQEARNRQVSARASSSDTPRSLTIKRQFLKDVEGYTTFMKVPTRHDGHVIGHSGPTICTGVDLGQRDLADLDRLGLPTPLGAKLQPYLGWRGEPALAFVKQHPLTLSEAECGLLDNAVHQRELRKLADHFDAESRVGPLSDLPLNTRTAIASVFFQYGADAPQKAAPVFWRQVTTGDWAGARDNLKSFGDAHTDRRREEAGLIDQDLKAGVLSRSVR